MTPRRRLELAGGVALYAVALLVHIDASQPSLVEYLPLQVFGSTALGLAFGTWRVLWINVLSAPALLFVDHTHHSEFEELSQTIVIFLIAYLLPTAVGVAVRQMWRDLSAPA